MMEQSMVDISSIAPRDFANGPSKQESTEHPLRQVSYLHPGGIDSTLLQDLRSKVAQALAERSIENLTLSEQKVIGGQIIWKVINEYSSLLLMKGKTPPAADEEQMIAKALVDRLWGLGDLQGLIEDPDIENIDVNGFDEVWITYHSGEKVRGPSAATSDDELIELVRSAGARFGLHERRFDAAHPELDLRLPDGSRLSAVMEVTTRPIVNIRRHRFVDLSLSELVEMGMLSDELANFLAAAVRARKNILIAGAMNSGKTTLLRALAAEIPPHERLVTIEQAFELGLDKQVERHPDCVAMESRPPNSEGVGEISMSRLVRRSLRMNASRVIVGEVLGEEVIPMLNAMSQGRSGSMATIHADSSAGAFRRLAAYAAQAPERLTLEASNLLIAGAVHFVVFIDSLQIEELKGYRGKLGTVGRSIPHDNLNISSNRSSLSKNNSTRRVHRFISSVREVVDADTSMIISNEIWKPGPTRQAIPGSPVRSDTLAELCLYGYQAD